MELFIFVLGIAATALANQAALKELTSGNNKFAASIYRELASNPEDNFLVSPLSAHLILALSLSGAKDQTAEEIRNVLHLPVCENIVNEEIHTLLQDLHKDPNYVIQTVNKIYLKNGYKINPEFSSVAEQIYGSKIENMNFDCRFQTAKLINKWVEEETEDKITNLIDPETVNNKTRAVLINALRLKANWSNPFHYFATVKHDFSSYDSIVNLDFMNIFSEEFNFYEKPHLNATFLELPFEGDNVSMTVVLPNDIDGLTTLEKYIDEVLEAPKTTHSDLFNVALPKFKMESRIDFKKILENLGVKKAFQEGEADFSGIADKKGELFIGDIVQKSFLEVDRNGVEGAAATYIVKIVNRNADIARNFVVDHPFIFYIRVKGMIVFLGRMILP